MKLDENLIKRFGEEIEEGLPIKYTCDLLEVSEPCYINWMQQGRSDRENEVKSTEALFFTTIKRAYAHFVRDSKKIIRKGDAGWQGTAWWLERTNKDFQMNADAAIVSENITINTKMRKKDKDNK